MKIPFLIATVLIVASLAAAATAAHRDEYMERHRHQRIEKPNVMPSSSASCPAPPQRSNMVLSFDDEFNERKLNTSKWTAVAAGGADAINNELQAYVPSAVHMMREGGLRLQAKREPFWDEQYTSGEIVSAGHFSQAYGYFEMKAKMPNGNGLWPAFWLLPDNTSWPPEIDVLEYIYAPFGAMPTLPNTTSGTFQTLHWKNKGGNEQSLGFTKYGDLGKTYHTYAVDWRPGSLMFIMDDQVQGCIVDSSNSGTRVPSQPMYILANLAIGPAGSWSGSVDNSTQFPANMDIAYIRAYKYKDVTPPPPEPITVTNVSISPSSTVTPGESITINADVNIGNNALPGSTAVQFLIYNYDGSQLIDTLNYNGPSSFTANTTYHVSLPYTFSSATAPGIYTFAVSPFWNNWASNLWIPQKLNPPITVTAAR